MSKSTKAPAEAAPKAYRALTGLTFPGDPAIVARLEAGEVIPHDERGEVFVGAGHVTTAIPAVSISWLLEAGAIEEVEADG